STLPENDGATPNVDCADHWNQGIHLASSSCACASARRARAAQRFGKLRSASARHSVSVYRCALMVAGALWVGSPKPPAASSSASSGAGEDGGEEGDEAGEAGGAGGDCAGGAGGLPARATALPIAIGPTTRLPKTDSTGSDARRGQGISCATL